MRWSVTSSDEMAAIYELYYHASDRAIGIVVASIVEMHLAGLIKKCFIQDTTAVKMAEADLFHSSGPLGSFSVKIKLAYLMSAVTEECYKNLNTMKEIRNRFAHRIEVGTFQFPEVFDRCMSFTLVDKIVM